MADVSDDFNRADEDPLSNGGLWSKPGWGADYLTVVGNTCRQRTTNLWGTAYWTQSFQADSYSQHHVNSPGNYCYTGNFLRAAGDLSANYYTAYLHTYVGGIGNISKVVNGAETALGASPTYVTNGTTFKFSCSGTTLAVDVTGQVQITRTDSTFASAGFAGIQRASALTNTGCEIDNWVGGPLSTSVIMSVFPLFRPAGGMA